jgi:predicted nuclease of restriction endonuclease-like RecB superfamily
VRLQTHSSTTTAKKKKKQQQKEAAPREKKNTKHTRKRRVHVGTCKGRATKEKKRNSHTRQNNNENKNMQHKKRALKPCKKIKTQTKQWKIEKKKTATDDFLRSASARLSLFTDSPLLSATRRNLCCQAQGTINGSHKLSWPRCCRTIKKKKKKQ